MERLVMSTCSILMALPLSAKCRKLLLRPPRKLFCAKLLCNLINTMSKAFCLSILPATSRGIRQPQLIKWFSTLAQPLFLPQHQHTNTNTMADTEPQVDEVAAETPAEAPAAEAEAEPAAEGGDAEAAPAEESEGGEEAPAEEPAAE